MVFTESVNVLPAFNNPDAYSANATAGLVMPVWEQFDAVLYGGRSAFE